MAGEKKASQVDLIFNHFKRGHHTKYVEEKHCRLLIEVMLNPNKGSHTAFCKEAMVCEKTFFNWVNAHELFASLYFYMRCVARELWEEEGRRIKDAEYLIGTINYSFEHWKLIGWSRFGISKTSRLKINLSPTDNPTKHYESILRQAAEGDFTASEFKQLMEAVNVGINVHQVFELQKQIDELKSDLITLTRNTNVKNPFTDKGIEKKD